MTHCRIGKVKFKSGGEIIPLKTQETTEFQHLLRDALKEAQGENITAAGVFFVTEETVYINRCGNFFEMSGALNRFQHDIQMERYTQE